MATRDGAWSRRWRHQQIPVSLGRGRATISVPGPLAASLRAALEDLLRPESGDPGTVVEVRRRRRGHRVSAGLFRADAEPGVTAVDQVVSALLTVTLDQQAAWLHLHAGYVARNGRGVFVAGPDGSGKTTLVAHLVAAGFDYFTDELVGIDRGLRLWTFPKPLSITAGSFATLPDLDPARTDRGVASPAVWHVPATAVRAGCVGTSATPAAVVFVRHVAGAEPAVEDLHPATAARRLLGDSPDAPRAAADGVRQAAELCAGLRCVELTYASAVDAVDAVRELVATHSEPMPVEVVSEVVSEGATHRTVVDAPLGRASVLAVASNVTVVAVGERALVWNPDRAEVVQLDEPSTVWLQLFDGSTHLGDLVDEVADASETAPQVLEETAIGIATALLEGGVIVSLA